ncbi:MAG TPA: hypothetical protein VN894_19845 [Polyangiaceae bacterium]|nr:hypothetical protein [Polyangiaceae bacterium]
MRRAVLPLVVALLFGPEASAQVAAASSGQIARAQAEVAGQVTFDTSYLLARYMTELALAGSAPSQADIDEAARQYFTNGAAVTGVPISGPGADYFRNGAEVMAYPAPGVPAAPQEADEAGAGSVAREVPEGDAGAPRDAAGDEEGGTGAPLLRPAPAAEANGGPAVATAPACPPSDIEAAMAIAGQFARAEAPLPMTMSWSCPPPVASAAVAPYAEVAPASTIKRAADCAPRSSFLSGVGPALGGAFLGGLAVALWSRPRALGVARRR